MSTDGSVVLDVNMNISQANKQLAKLKQDIEKAEKEIAETTKRRDEARQKSIFDATALDEEKVKLQEIKDRLADLRAMSKDRSIDRVTRSEYKSMIPGVQEELSEQRTRVASLQSDWNKLENSVDKYDAKIAETTAKLEQQKIVAGTLEEQIEAAEQARTEALKNAEVADQRIVDLNRELLELKERQKELEALGIGVGYQEYDQNSTRIAEINQELKEYQRQLQEVGEAEKDEAESINRTSQASGRLLSILGNMGPVLSGIGAAIKKIPAMLKKIARNILDVAEETNVLIKVSEAVGKKFKRLWQMLRRVFVFSVITMGLRAIRKQVAEYLKLNTEFSTALSRLQGVLLTAFQPIYEAVVPALTTLINVLSRAIATVTEFVSVLFGTTAKQAQKNAESLYNQASALEATGSAAEDAAGSLAGFDEINTISTESSSGSGSSETETGPLFDWEYDETPFESWGEAFSAFLDKLIAGIPKLEEAFKGFADKLNDFSKNLYEMFTFPGVLDKVKQLGQDLAGAFNNLVNWIDWNQLGHALGAGLNTALQFLVNLLYTFDWINLGRNLAEFVNGAVSEIDWYALGQLLWAGWKIAIETLAGFILGLNMPALAEAASNVIKGFFDSMKDTLERIDWKAIGAQIAEFLNNLDWDGIIESISGALEALVEAAIDLIGEFIENADPETLIFACGVLGALLLKGIIRTVIAPLAKTLIGKIIEKIAEGLTSSGLSSILSTIGSAIQAIGPIIGGIVAIVSGAFLAVSNFVKMLTDGFSWLNEVLMLLGIAIAAVGAVILGVPALVAAVIAAIVAAVATLVIVIKDHWEEIKAAFSAVVDFIKERFEQYIEDQKQKIEAVIQFFSDAWEAIKQFASDAWQGIQDIWGVVSGWFDENIIQPLAEFFMGLWESVGQLAADAWDGIVSVWETVSGWFDTNVIQPVSQFFSGLFDGIWQTASNIWSDIQELWGAASQWFEEHVTGPLGEAFDAVGEFIKGVFNGIISTVEGLVNSVIKAINFLISGINKLSIQIPDNPITGPLNIGFNIPKISEVALPRLAQGAVIPANREFMAVLGDQSYGNNLEAPEGLIRKIVREESGAGNTELLQAILEAIQAGHIIMVDRRVLGQTVTQEQNRMTRQSGRSVVLG